MHSVVSLLDDQHYALVENLWAEMEARIGVRGIYVTPYPHFTYQVAAHYDIAQLESILQRFASQTAMFQVRTTGLGIFTGSNPVLYIPVVRTPELTRLHQSLWPELSRAASGIESYYHPDTWMPHISIGFGDITSENITKIVHLLAERDFNWKINVNNFSFINDTGARQELHRKYTLG